jgi:hypothetical protein
MTNWQKHRNFRKYENADGSYTYTVTINGEKVEVSKEIYEVYAEGGYKMENMELAPKRNRVLKDSKGNAVKDKYGNHVTLPEREVSLDKLMDKDWDYKSSEPSPEDAVLSLEESEGKELQPHSQRRQKLTRERVKWEKTINSADKTLSAAYTHHLDDLLDIREFEVIRAKVERDKQDAATHMAAIESELRKYKDMADSHSHWRKVYTAFRAAETPTKELIQALVSQIELTPLTNEIHVIFNYRDGMEEYRDMLESGVSVYA